MTKNLKMIALAAIGLGLPMHAYAYLDPGTGSVIIQALIALVVAGGMYLRRIRDFVAGIFTGRGRAGKDAEPTAPVATQNNDAAGN